MLYLLLPYQEGWKTLKSNIKDNQNAIDLTTEVVMMPNNLIETFVRTKKMGCWRPIISNTGKQRFAGDTLSQMLLFMGHE